MSDSKKVQGQGFSGRELLGMALFTLAAFPLVLVAMDLASGSDPALPATGMRGVARSIVGSVGYLPALIGSGGFALVGGAMVLAGRGVDAGRHLAGFLFTALGLAVCLGALHPSGEGFLHGGAFGDATGGTLRAIGPWAGLIVGGAVAFSAVWLAWLGGIEAAGRGLQRGRGFQKNPGQTPTISDALSERESDGVSTAEANALVPDAETLTYMEELWQDGLHAVQPQPIPPSPYPEDVRLKGQVPEGARPLTCDDDDSSTHGAADPGAATWRPAHHQRQAGNASDVDLAGAVPSAPAPAEPQARPARAEGASETLASPLPQAAPEEAGPPKPAWEQEPLFEQASTDEGDLPLLVTEEVALDPVPAPEIEEEDEEYEEEEFEEDEEVAEYDEEECEDELEEEEDDEEEEYEDEEAAELEEEEYEEEELDELEEEECEEEEEVAEDEEEEDDEAEDSAELPFAEPEPEPEPEVVLRPAAPTQARGTDSPASRDLPTAGDLSHEELVHEAGRLFLTHGRVAVSLLQRRFNLDFDDACEVLDELQELGLIGPYLGGQKRDILLSPDEWEGRLAGS